MSNVLVLEDEVIIALDLEMTLNELGFADVLMASSVDQAFTLLAASEVSVAILDFSLGDETSEPVISWLKERAVPFIVMTGYLDRAHLGDGADEWLLLGKPANRAALSQALTTLGIAPIAAGNMQALPQEASDGAST